MKSYHLIKNVNSGSIAEEMGIEPGDYLLKINGEILEDVFDYHYMINDEYIEVLIKKGNSDEEWLLEIDKEYDEDLGIEFENSLLDNYKSCSNKCIFCFIDQMPKGMRETLYFKDDDSRLSFLQGNYITLTNMKDKDIDRIIKYHLCPINISVHTTNKDLRCKMLNNRFAGKVLSMIDKLAENFIEMNGQIVLCKGVNDKDELINTIKDLSKYIPHMQSVSVVPAGLTKFREGLYPLEIFNKQDAIEVIDTIEAFQKEFFDKYGIHFIHASDEWYILAERDFPEEDRYDGYLQIENGVGMMRSLKNEFLEALSDVDGDNVSRKITLVTGKLAYNMLQDLTSLISEKFSNTEISVIPIRNDFFGESITVSGLLTGTDIYAQLKDLDLGDRLLLPANVLRSGEEVFLDDMTLSELGNKLNISISIVGSNGQALLEALTDMNYKKEEYNKSNYNYIQCYDIEKEK